MEPAEQDGLKRAMDAQIRHKGDVEAIHKSFDLIAIQYIRDSGATQLADALQMSPIVKQFKYEGK